MHFRHYRKVLPTIARVLTEQDYQAYAGVIHTREGDKAFVPGDYLARDPLGVWPIQKATLETGYRRIGEGDHEGWFTYQPLRVVLAAPLPESFTIGELTGLPGDYLVIAADNVWPVAASVFEAAYIPVEPLV